VKGRFTDFDGEEAEILHRAGSLFEGWAAAHAGCPPPRVLRAAKAGALPEEMAEQVAAHVGSCALCSKLLADFEACETQELTPDETQQLYAQIHHAIGKEKARAESAGWSFRWRPSIALAGIVLLALLGLWRVGHFPASQKISAPPAPPNVAKTSVPEPVQTVFVLTKPQVRLTAAALVWRGSGGNQQFSKDLGAAFDSYRADDYAAAEKKFSRLAAEYPKSVEAAFYLAVCRLFLNQTSGAIAAFEKAQPLADDSFASDIAWYLSLGYHRAGESAKARLLLSRLCQGRSEYATNACAGLQELEKRPPESSSR
jgi:TolA-binding protein